ncbi:MAG: 50S ribosomal protein L10 [Candidatus Aenigmarchaeota archaeon]|nr:50S ribosomal protein L10 [Candidatus Aenigmarchaeota archaeon]
MTSKRNQEKYSKIKPEIGKYSVIGVLDVHKLPARQLQEMKDKLQSQAKITIVKKALVKMILKELKKDNIDKLEQYIGNYPALLLSNANVFELARVIDKAKSPANAKAGDISPKDIMVKAGPTPLPPGPAIGDLQRLKIPAGVEGDKIAVKKDTVVLKEGQEVTKAHADLFMKLGIQPMEIGLNLLAAWDNGMVFGKDVLFVPLEEYSNKITNAYRNAFNLSYNAGYLTKETTPFLIMKAHMEAMNLAINANIVTKKTVGPIFAKAHGQMNAVREAAKL